MHHHHLDHLRNWTLGLLLLTSLHHGWGAYIYAAPFRLHVVALAIPLAILITWLLRSVRSPSYGARLKRGLLLTALALVAVVVAGIGFFEGGYNHIVKNVLYFAGVPATQLLALFPPPTYEMPDNLFFEATGILQFPVSLFVASAAFRLVKQGLPVRGMPA
jgi:hypothetical protein